MAKQSNRLVELLAVAHHTEQHLAGLSDRANSLRENYFAARRLRIRISAALYKMELGRGSTNSAEEIQAEIDLLSIDDFILYAENAIEEIGDGLSNE